MSPQDAKNIIIRLTDFKPQTLHLLGSGTDNVAFLVNDSWVFRFAKTEMARLGLEKEIKLLPILKKALTLEVPNFNYVGTDNDELMFVGYRTLKGKPLDKRIFAKLDTSCQEEILKKLSKFMRQVHDFPIDKLLNTGVKIEKFKGAFNEYQYDFPEQLKHILTKEEVFRLGTLFEEYIQSSKSNLEELVLLHADLKPEHIMFDDKSLQLKGVIDWGDVCIGSPTYDFVSLSQFYSKDFVRRLLNYFPEYQLSKIFRDIWFLSIVRALQDMLIDDEYGDTIAVKTCHEQIKMLLREKQF